MRLSNGALLVRLTGGSRTEERRGDTAGRSCRGEGGGMSGAPATERWRKAAARLVTAREAMGRSGGAAAACSVLAVTMKVALALSPENAVEAPSSLTSRVRGTWPDRQLACMRRSGRPLLGSAKRRYTPKSAYLEPIGGFASRTFLVYYQSYEPPRATCSLTGQGAGGYKTHAVPHPTPHGHTRSCAESLASRDRTCYIVSRPALASRHTRAAGGTDPTVAAEWPSGLSFSRVRVHHVHAVKDARELVVANLLRVHEGLLRHVAGLVEADESLLVLRRCGRQAAIFRIVPQDAHERVEEERLQASAVLVRTATQRLVYSMAKSSAPARIWFSSSIESFLPSALLGWRRDTLYVKSDDAIKLTYRYTRRHTAPPDVTTPHPTSVVTRPHPIMRRESRIAIEYTARCVSTVWAHH
jgi:hypothetical protein